MAQHLVLAPMQLAGWQSTGWTISNSDELRELQMHIIISDFWIMH